ncbi:MAG: hypothetical protein SFW35_02005 [Chitinophagales bacterium]|nr:hypothetical protein [Chitinophagales bacterium]
MTKFNILPLAIVLLFTASCGSGTGDSGSAQDSTTVTKDTLANDATSASEVVMEKNGIRLTKVNNSPDFPEAKLKLLSPKSNEWVKTGKVEFKTSVENYELKKQTVRVYDHCANSEQGQHIHLILNNEPYTAHYDTTFERDLQPGGYVALLFLSRSYHESLKHKDAYVVDYFSVGNKAVKNDVDLKAPLLFYSRPKGEYKGEKETKKVLLDYFLANTELSETGNKVKATIDGTEFVLTKWEPYFIEGLPLGEHTIKLELIDKDGKTIPNKFNPVERKITLSPAPAQ